VKKFTTVLLFAAFAVTLFALSACTQSAGDPMVGKWGMVDNPTKTVTISKEGDKYFYEGSQGKMPAVKKDDNTLMVSMGPVEVNVKYDAKSGELGVSFMGENYRYKKVK